MVTAGGGPSKDHQRELNRVCLKDIYKCFVYFPAQFLPVRKKLNIIPLRSAKKSKNSEIPKKEQVTETRS